MIDLTKLTLDQANKIECFLVTCQDDIEHTIDSCDELAADQTLPENIRMTFASNAQWYRDLYHLIYEKEYTANGKP